MFRLSVIVVGGRTLLKLEVPTEDQSAYVEECILDPKSLRDQNYLSGRLMGYPDPLLPFITVEASIFSINPKIIWEKKLITYNAKSEIIIELDLHKNQAALLKTFDEDTRKYVYTSLSPQDLHDELDKRVEKLKILLDNEVKSIVYDIGLFDED